LGDAANDNPIPYYAYDGLLVRGKPYPGSVTLGVLDGVIGRGRNLATELKRTGGKGVPHES